MSTLKKAIPERFTDARNAINTKYQALSFLQSKGYQIESNRQICCPFHDDSTPSFSINSERNVWNCFGCHDGGHFIDLWVKYHNRYENTKHNIYTAIETILAADTDLQSELGFNTIYKTEEQEYDLFKLIDGKLPNFDQILQRNTEIFSVDTTSMHNVLKALQEQPIEVLLKFIADCECGATEAQLISKYYRHQDSIETFISQMEESNEDYTSAFLEALED